jgi:hypothetical protein
MVWFNCSDELEDDVLLLKRRERRRRLESEGGRKSCLRHNVG